MITLIYFLTGAVALWFLRQIWPVRSLSYINARDWMQVKERLNLKMLDVRDASDYLEVHVSGSINISLGRLPFVWQHELSPDEGVIILSNTGYHSNKAARILRKHGFRNLYAIQGRVCPAQASIKKICANSVIHCGHRFNH